MKRHRLVAVVAAFLTLASVVALTAAAPAGARGRGSGRGFSLTILHNNDGESQLINAGSGIEDFGGVARFATVVRNARAEANRGGGGSLLVSSGDNFLAGPEFTASLVNGVPFFDTTALDMLGYDAISLGNHDFDFGPDVLADFLSGYEHEGRPPYLSANLDFSAEPELQAFVDSGVIAASTVVREKGHDIGVVGAVTPVLPTISSPGGVVVDPNVAGAVQAEVDDLEAAGIDKIVMISHLQDIDADIALASQLDGVDVMVAGGGDELLANPGDPLVPGDGPPFGPYPMTATDATGDGVPVVTTAGSYKYLGALTVEFDAAGEVVDAAGGPIRVAGGDNPDAVRSSNRMQKRVVEPVAEFLAALESTVIAHSEVDLDGLRSNVRFSETNEGNLIADSQLWQAREVAADYGVAPPDLVLQNGGGIRNDTVIPAGPITLLDTFDMVPFPNFVTVVENVPRTQVKELLENAVSRTQPGDLPGGTGRFAQVAGLRFTYLAGGTAMVIDVDGNVTTPGTRIEDATLDDGTPIVAGGAVVPGPDLTVGTVDFLARGGDQYPFRGLPFTSVGVSYQLALADYLQGPLAGTITAADYPQGGEGRILAFFQWP